MAEPSRPSVLPWRSHGLVLLVDDNGPLRRALGRGLRRAGHKVAVASSGSEAVVALSAAEFDLVVSDVRMPDMNGVELLRKVREHDSDLPVVLMSGDPDLDTAMKAVEYGALEYLMKPIALGKLEGCVLRALEVRRTRLEASRALKAQSGDRAREASPVGVASSLTGSLLDGRYRVGALLGRGGMGAVYEAEREDLARMRVAVKVLDPSASARPVVLSRFRREAETVAAIDHPNIVRILDFRTPPDGPAFLVMERLYGAPLTAVIADEGRFSAERAAFVAYQVLGALSATHRAGVVHRDLKPDNVFLTSMSGVRDLVKLLDFGIVKIIGASRDAKLTQTGAVVGTPAYMSPEQARGSKVDPRTDLYAVGCVLYEAVTGCAPFSAENYNALLAAIIRGKPKPLMALRSDLDLDFATVVTKAMSREPAARFQTAESMQDALASWLSPTSTSPSRPVISSPAAFAPTALGPSVRTRKRRTRKR
jgi:CheY-like chemotaxis protein